MLNVKKVLTKILTGLAGKLDKSGGTLTDNLMIERANFPAYTTRSSYDSAVGVDVPASGLYGYGGFLRYDKNTNRVFYSETDKDTADTLYTSFVTIRVINGSNVAHGFYNRIDKNGNFLTTFTNADARDAWGNGLTVAMGNPTIASGVGATVAANTSCRIGKQVSINMRLTGATLAAGTAQIMTLPSGFRPKAEAFGVLLIGGVYRNCAISTAGVVTVYGGVAVSNAEIKLASTFLSA